MSTHIDTIHNDKGVNFPVKYPLKTLLLVATVSVTGLTIMARHWTFLDFYKDFQTVAHMTGKKSAQSASKQRGDKSTTADDGEPSKKICIISTETEDKWIRENKKMVQTTLQLKPETKSKMHLKACSLFTRSKSACASGRFMQGFRKDEHQYSIGYEEIACQRHT